jgi:hypothetical protein
VTVRTPGASRQAEQGKWEIIRYAIDSTPRTIRLCVILLAASIPPGLVALIIHH